MSDAEGSLPIRWGPDGLIPAIVQHAQTGEVLMLGYVNEESWRLTRETGTVWFRSRSRRELWQKGATSGNYLRLQGARLDCDGDTLLLLALPDGPTCHTDERSCFHREIGPGETASRPDVVREPAVAPSGAVVDEVFGVILERKRTMPEGSYVRYLLAEGIDKIDKKMGEETAEVIVASKNGVPERLAAELADLYFHSLVLLAACDMSPQDVWEQLRERRR